METSDLTDFGEDSGQPCTFCNGEDDTPDVTQVELSLPTMPSTSAQPISGHEAETPSKDKKKDAEALDPFRQFSSATKSKIPDLEGKNLYVIHIRVSKCIHNLLLLINDRVYEVRISFKWINAFRQL